MTSNKNNSPSDPTRVGRKNGSHQLRRDVNLDAVDVGSGEHPVLTMEPRLECLETVAVLRSLNEPAGLLLSLCLFGGDNNSYKTGYACVRSGRNNCSCRLTAARQYVRE